MPYSRAAFKFGTCIILLLIHTCASSQSLVVDTLIHIYTQKNPLSETLIDNDVRLKGFVSNSEVKYVSEQIKKAIEKYPSTFLLSQLERIEIPKLITKKNKKISGYAYNKTLYIGAKHNYELEKTFHQEFALMLLYTGPLHLDSNRWRELRDPAILELFHKKSLGLFKKKIDPSFFFGNGYLEQDALRNVDSDFTSFASNLFSGGKQFWVLVDANPIIKQKALLTISFYHQLYPIFTEKWFRFLAEFRLF